MTLFMCDDTTMLGWVLLYQKPCFIVGLSFEIPFNLFKEKLLFVDYLDLFPNYHVTSNHFYFCFSILCFQELDLLSELSNIPFHLLYIFSSQPSLSLHFDIPSFDLVSLL